MYPQPVVDYDLEQTMKEIKAIAGKCLFMGLLHYYWGMGLPLIIQAVLTPITFVKVCS